MKKTFSVLLCFILLFCTASAHAGRTDANGGHWDHSTGEYHYHHGYPAHQHTNGICPYDYNDQTELSSGSSSYSADTNYITNTQANKYNSGLGDDGTYETAYNLGYQHGMEAALSDTVGFPIDLSSHASELCAANALTGKTMLSDIGETYDSAYEAGFLQAKTDLSNYINEITTPGLSNSETGEFIAYEDVPALLDEYKRQADENYDIGYEDGMTEGTKYGKTVGEKEAYQSAQNKYQIIIISGTIIFLIILVFVWKLLKKAIIQSESTIKKQNAVINAICLQLNKNETHTITRDEVQQIFNEHNK